MTPNPQQTRRGFTLVELSIVLGIVGVLATGIWQMISASNVNTKNQNTATQQQQLISSVSAFLASTGGQAFMISNPGCTGAVTTGTNKTCAAFANFNLTLNACASLPTDNSQAFCNYLPTQFTALTVNPYGQTYSIQVLRDNTAAPSPPTTYSFMIVTSVGTVITDSSGGQITNLIGGDGGFLYANKVNQCPAATAAVPTACGANQTWQFNVKATYGFLAGLATPGHVATRTYIAPEMNASNPWLARTLLLSDVTYNSMSVPLFMGAETSGIGQNLYMSPSQDKVGTPTTTGGGTIHMEGGIINLEGGLIQDSTTTGFISMGPNLGSYPRNTLVSLGTNCTSSSFGVITGLVSKPLSLCPPGLLVSGDATVTGLMTANVFFSQSFVYQSSDRRLKKNIRPIETSLDKVMRLKPVSYNFKEGGHAGLGVIAQDIEKIYPQLVVDRPDGMKSVNYDGLIAPLISAVQELKHENEQLRKDIKAEEAQRLQLERELHPPSE